eukprot:CAMPEP_0115871696 /NCGR_PEP_ID=MMETSP0287-20121206/23021_1 /TAXON_ID=412157 /ORGANISM="Chrysochromulina rotalis, Strain UIO044" /LENGTH=88 /DNA_ID=CAMNT_0003326549 /DNA_START=145 /DNA_END=408 /DNA_ORIENTATION=+
MDGRRDAGHRCELTVRDGENGAARAWWVHAFCVRTGLLCAHVLSESHTAHKDVEDIARVGHVVCVQPLMQIRCCMVLPINLGVLVTFA